eukprot:COSAG02_NODE_148_length_33809_cov_158.369594_23_plen_1464_part_00
MCAVTSMLRDADPTIRCTQLVLRCANALNRSQKNLPVYVSDASVSLQFAALGSENVAKILRLSEKSLPMSDEDASQLLGIVNPAVRSPKLNGNNGAKAALSVLKWLAGPVAKAAKAAPVRRPGGSARSGAQRKARAQDTSAWEASIADAYTSAAAKARAADPELGGASMLKFYSKPAQVARKRLIGGSPSKRRRVQTHREPDVHGPSVSRGSSRTEKRGRGRGRARGRGRGRLFPTLVEFSEGYTAHWAAVQRNHGLEALPLPAELPISVEDDGHAAREDRDENCKLWHLLRMVCQNGGGMVCSVHKRWDDVAEAVGLSAEQHVDLKTYYDRALLSYELKEELAVNVKTKRPRSSEEGRRAEKRASRRPRSAGDSAQARQSTTAAEPTLPALLTANEKAEIEHAICSGHLGTRLTEAEVRYFSAIVNDDAQDVAAAGTNAATVDTTLSVSSLGVEGEPAYLIRTQHQSNEAVRNSKNTLATRLLRAHEYAIRHTQWTGKKAAGVGCLEQEALTKYVLVRDALMYKWYKSKGRYLTTKDAIAGIKKDAKPMAVLAWGYLSLHGHINFGLPMPMSAPTLPVADPSQLAAPPASAPATAATRTNKRKVVVVGAGLAGLAAALQLQRFGADVVLIEARSRVGGRCYTVGAKHGGGELGANFIHGVRGNPLTIVAGQLNQPMFMLGEGCPLYKAPDQGGIVSESRGAHHDRMVDDGPRTALPNSNVSPLVESKLDLQVESRFNRILATTDHWRSEHNKAAAANAKAEGHVAAEQRRRSPQATYFAPQVLVDQEHKHGSIQHKSLLDAAKVNKDNADAAWNGVPFPPLPSNWANDSRWLDTVSLGETITAAAAVTGPSPSVAVGDSMAEEQPILGSTACAKQLLNWHLANLEYANGVRLEDLSLAYWDDDDPWEYRGQHALLPAGFSALCEGLAAEISCLKLDTEVDCIEHEANFVRVHCKPASQQDQDHDSNQTKQTKHIIEADAVIVTVPLGVLKASLPARVRSTHVSHESQPKGEQSGTAIEAHLQNGPVSAQRPVLKFNPPLNGAQAEAVRRLGFGLLNKVVLHFPSVFWERPVASDGKEATDLSPSDVDELRNGHDTVIDDMIGRLCADESQRGEYFQLISMARATGEPTLVALVAGQAAEEQEKRSDDEVVQAVMGALRSMFGGQSSSNGGEAAVASQTIPDPLHVEISRWLADAYSQGSYSYQAVGSSPADREALAGDSNSVALAEAAAAVNASNANSSTAPAKKRKERNNQRSVSKLAAERDAWEMHTDDANAGSTYWWNSVTGESRWTDPHADPSTQWEENIDDKSGRKYWWNKITHESRWTDPAHDENADTTEQKTPAAVDAAEQREPTSVKSEGQSINMDVRTDQTFAKSGDEPRPQWWEGGTSGARIAAGDRVITSYEVEGVMKSFTGIVQHVDWQKQQHEVTAKQEGGGTGSSLADVHGPRRDKSSAPFLVIKFDT